MNVNQIKTRKIVPPKDDLEDLLSYIPKLKNGSIVAVSSKVISICEGSTLPIDSISHDKLVSRLASKSIEPIKRGANDMILTQVGNLLVESAGVDQSNANGYYILLPHHPYKTAKTIWSYLRKRDHVKTLGVVITDSHSVPRRKGAEGFALASYGFKAAHVYEHKADIFGRTFHFTASDIADSLAASAVLTMGEGAECTPMAIITGLQNIDFFKRSVSLLVASKYGWVHPKYDVYAPLLNSSAWHASK
jgi:F420-0:gamma-glutamyl ligase